MGKLFSFSPGSALRRLDRSPSGLIGSTATIASLVLAALLVVASAMAFDAASKQERADAWETHTRTVLAEIASLRLATLMVVRGERGYLLTGDEVSLESYDAGRSMAHRSLVRLNTLLNGNPVQSRRFATLLETAESHHASTDLVITMMRQGSAQAAVDRVRSGLGRNDIESILQQLDVLEAEEDRLLAARTSNARDAARRVSLFVRLLGLVGILLFAVGCLFAHALRRSLARERAALEKLRITATTDELTGLANRRELLASLDRMIAGARRSGRPLSLAILDIDHFKRVNDNHGHAAGDEVIRSMGNIIASLMRRQDLVGRLGGEEFVVVFPDCDAAAAVEACERLRRKIGELRIIVEHGVTLRVTLSSGIAQWQEGDDRTRLIARADEALYDAKQGGRDQVRLAA